MTHDPVNRPSHYVGAIESIDAIAEAIRQESDPFVAYLRGNAMKYVWRAGKKGDQAEDLRKAVWYLTRAVQHIESRTHPETTAP